MIEKRQYLKALYLINKYDNSLLMEWFNHEFDEYKGLLFELMGKGLIQGVDVQDNDKSQLDISNIELTPMGSDYLKEFDSEIDKNILEILYTMRYDKTQSESKIRKSLFLSLIPHEVLAHINLLVDKQLIKEERERIAAFKSKDKRFNIPAHTNITYRISDKGIKLYENDFIEPERPFQPKTIFNISGGVVNFGTIHNLNINYIEELKVLIPEEDKRRDIEEYFNEIHEVAKNENIEKRRLKEIFNKLSSKIAEKGLDKIGDKLIDLLWLYFISNMSL